MKKWVGIILVGAFVLFAIADLIHDFVANDTLRYFSEQPRRLWLVAVIGLAGGLVTFGFYALSSRWQRRTKLAVLGASGGLALLASGYFACLAFRLALLPPELPLAFPWHLPLLISACCLFIVGMLGFEFYQIWKKHDSVDK